MTKKETASDEQMLSPKNIFDADHLAIFGIFDGCIYPWEALPKIADCIRSYAETLSADEYDNPAPEVWISKKAEVAPTAFIKGPCVIEEGAEVRHCAYIRGSVYVGKGAVVGNSTELKNAVLSDGVQVPHYNYVGDSILGYKAHMGAGSIASNVKGDKKNIVVHTEDENIETGLRKFGVMLGDGVEVGCGSVLNPGTVVGRGARIYPLSCVRGYVPEGYLYKKSGEILKLREE